MAKNKGVKFSQNLMKHATFGNPFRIFSKSKNIYIQDMYTLTNFHDNRTKNKSYRRFSTIKKTVPGKSLE